MQGMQLLTVLMQHLLLLVNAQHMQRKMEAQKYNWIPHHHIPYSIQHLYPAISTSIMQKHRMAIAWVLLLTSCQNKLQNLYHMQQTAQEQQLNMLQLLQLFVMSTQRCYLYTTQRIDQCSTCHCPHLARNPCLPKRYT